MLCVHLGHAAEGFVDSVAQYQLFKLGDWDSRCVGEARWFTEGELIRAVAGRMIEDIRILDTLVGCPDQVIPQATYERLLGYAEQLKAMSFLPTPEESTRHEQEITAWLESIGEDPVSWLDMYRASQLRPTPES